MTKRTPHLCPSCGGEGCQSCVAGVVFRKPRAYHRAEGHSAGNTRSHRADVINDEPHGNGAIAKQASVKLYRIGFETRRLPGEGVTW